MVDTLAAYYFQLLLWTYYTFENNFGINHIFFYAYFEGEVWIVFVLAFYLVYIFTKYAQVKKILV